MEKPSCYLLVAIVVSVFSSTVAAQSILKYPNYGSVTLVAGFSPDPQVSSMSAGGVEQFSSCTGYFSQTSDFAVNYESGTFNLGFFVKSDVDTTLAINTPDGDLICNDDSEYLTGNHPGALIESPQSGLYNIWLGVYSQDDLYEWGNLAITELATADWDGAVLTENFIEPSVLNISAAPTYGAISLAAGFSPDLNVHDITAGGSFSEAEGVGDCIGYFSSQPDLNLNYTAGDFNLGVFARADEDTIIAIKDASGAWICNDDSEYMTDFNPAVLLESPVSGLYNIWVGSHSLVSSPLAQLVITELGADSWSTVDLDRDNSQAQDLDFAGDPNFGTVDLQSGFTADPHSTYILAGGSIESSHCSGYFSIEPDLNLNWQSGDLALGFIAQSEGDTTIVVNDPSGNWYCNDDSEFLDNSSAAILFDNAASGLYNIWIGTYGSDTALSLNAQLLITEQDTVSWSTLGSNTEEPDSGPVNSRVQFGRKNN